jgi:Phage ABA sandwich domain
VTDTAELVAGRELDERVAAALGWKLLEGAAVSLKWRHASEPVAKQRCWIKDGKQIACDLCGDLPPFSTNLVAAFDVVEHFRKQDHLWSIECGSWGWLVIRSHGICSYSTDGDELPLAICRAALDE